VSRARKAGVPEDLIKGSDPLFEAVAQAKLAGDDPEQRLRASARAFAAELRAAEGAARDLGLDQHRLDEKQWHQFWSA
jgi:XTP/dITP diphosphohydrolase